MDRKGKKVVADDRFVFRKHKETRRAIWAEADHRKDNRFVDLDKAFGDVNWQKFSKYWKK